jgi:hypothetical protein
MDRQEHVCGPSFVGLMQYLACVSARIPHFRRCNAVRLWDIAWARASIFSKAARITFWRSNQSGALDRAGAANWSAASEFGGRQDLSREGGVTST